MEITEPATLLTDYFMAALAVAWYFRLGRDREMPVLQDWRKVFLFLALSSFLGGSYHGYQAMLTPLVLEALWRGTLVCAALSSLFLMKAGVGQFGGSGQAGWKKFAYLKALVILVIGQAWPDFLVVLVDFTLSLFIVSAFALLKWERAFDARAKFLAGTGLFLLGGAVQALGLAPHPAFNHNDLFHVIQILGNWMFYLCARDCVKQA